MHIGEAGNRKLFADFLRFLDVNVTDSGQLGTLYLAKAQQLRVPFCDAATAYDRKVEHNFLPRREKS